ncbi:protein-methionine-sulfoxide reductase heme-binding subunit MsrQ [Colwellia sp. 4_MG-2023]|uniref:protein-methionine-sulfoxide reductase heme-binding subunit MsrQ n=1 Tax=unclassified Colwellia TaxID=196834 RepID=UPI0026E29181|nr:MULTISPECIES: protein-methionine-sulfoxide reductase heme-binding subunit MsrQ [unclassified Colwellia]MDO6488953.1 protein-methionine-sulfoxide reductase heme-binding subunit MsrQ [Colwellia sp. 6_MG-2023]MDO6507947.1 protein-methionine-sulfoxide reductase heme-binding subunit MsrQ [Colwellia sp. 5_MG-2023]MDO6556687.1 protein-methionine-sulfoxide reductase heme-binding subunit MsrQ [Colwellia sp. 4_MG-2023]
MKNDTKVFLLKVLIHLGALIPLVNLYFLAFNDKLGADPVESVIHFTGIGAFNLLLITLSVTPIAQLTKQGYLLNVRRLLGLYAYTYALFHLVNFLSFEIQFDGALFISEVWKRPYITIGMAAFFLLTALSITSINKLKRKMGKSWQQLHNVSYIIILLVAIHFYWSVKSELTSPLFYFAMAIMLLLFRYKKIKRLFLSTFN